MNPNYCDTCDRFVRTHPGGAEVEISMLFADVRGSTALAEQMPPTEFSRLMNRFYDCANRIVIDSDGLVDKLVGDEVVALYVPAVGSDHARKAVEAAGDLLRATADLVPVGAGVHTGVAYVGSVGSESTVADFTALGDAVNVTARLASLAGSVRHSISEAACTASGSDSAARAARACGQAETRPCGAGPSRLDDVDDRERASSRDSGCREHRVARVAGEIDKRPRPVAAQRAGSTRGTSSLGSSSGRSGWHGRPVPARPS